MGLPMSSSWAGKSSKEARPRDQGPKKRDKSAKIGLIAKRPFAGSGARLPTDRVDLTFRDGGGGRNPLSNPFSLPYHQKLVCRLVGNGIHRAGWPADGDFVHLGGRAQSKMRSGVAGRQETAVGAHLLHLRVSRGVDLDASAKAVAVGPFALGFYGNPVGFRRLLRRFVSQQNRRPIQLCNHHIHKTSIFK